MFIFKINLNASAHEKAFLLTLFSILFLGGCKKSSENKSPLFVVEKINNHQISLEMASNIAIVNSIYPEPLGRQMTTSIHSKKSIWTAKVQKTNPAKSIKSTFTYKDNLGDASFYIVNFNEGGFIIVSGDDRIYPILAFSEKNNIPVENISKLNYGLVNWFQQRHEFAKMVKLRNIRQSFVVKNQWTEIAIKSQIVNGNRNVMVVFPECLEEGQTFWDTETYGPLLDTQWDQYGGNTLLPNFGCSQPFNGYAFTGCVATAMGQIMKYHQYPTSYNWSVMSSTVADNGLMYDIGIAVDMDHGCFISFGDGTAGTSSGASEANRLLIDDAFKNDFGYSSANHDDYDLDVVIDNILNNKPIILSAADTGSQDAGRHSWVADGVKNIRFYECHIGEEIPSENRGIPPGQNTYWNQMAGYLYLHMNWGMSPNVNGWFGYGDFTPDIYSYNENMKMIKNITP